MALTSAGTATGACPPAAGWPGGGCCQDLQLFMVVVTQR